MWVQLRSIHFRLSSLRGTYIFPVHRRLLLRLWCYDYHAIVLPPPEGLFLGMPCLQQPHYPNILMVRKKVDSTSWFAWKKKQLLFWIK